MYFPLDLLFMGNGMLPDVTSVKSVVSCFSDTIDDTFKVLCITWKMVLAIH